MSDRENPGFKSRLSRRNFFKGIGLTTAVAALSQVPGALDKKVIPWIEEKKQDLEIEEYWNNLASFFTKFGTKNSENWKEPQEQITEEWISEKISFIDNYFAEHSISEHVTFNDTVYKNTGVDPQTGQLEGMRVLASSKTLEINKQHLANSRAPQVFLTLLHEKYHLATANAGYDLENMEATAQIFAMNTAATIAKDESVDSDIRKLAKQGVVDYFAQIGERFLFTTALIHPKKKDAYIDLINEVYGNDKKQLIQYFNDIYNDKTKRDYEVDRFKKYFQRPLLLIQSARDSKRGRLNEGQILIANNHNYQELYSRLEGQEYPPNYLVQPTEEQLKNLSTLDITPLIEFIDQK